MTRNYAQIVEALEMFANAHPGIQRFQSAFFDKINSFTTEDNTWPIMYATPQDVSFNQNTNVYRFRIYVLDILSKDRSNQPYILLATSEIQRDLVNWIRDPQNPLSITNNPSIVTVNNFGTEGSIGWQMDLSISAPAITTECSLPFPGLEVSGLTCDYTYVSDFITCDDLNECPIIIDINDRIDAIVVSADTFVTNGSYDNPSGTLSLVRNDGNILSISGFTTGATGGTDIYVTGGTFNSGSETLTLSRNDNQNVIITGFTSGVGFDVFVTGGTYSNSTGTATFTNNTGGTFTVNGFLTGSTATVSWGEIQGTLSNQTDLINVLDGKADITGDTFTGLLGAINGFDFTGNGNDVTQIVRTGNADLLFSHSGSGDIVISSSGSGTILQDGTEFQQDITVPDEAYGASWNNSLEVPTKNAIYDKIESLTDIRVTGGTYNNLNGIATFTNNTGGTFNVSGFSTGGGTTFTGGTVSGETIFTNGLSANTFSATTYLNLPIDVRVTGGTFNGSQIEFTNNTGGTFNVTGFTNTTGGIATWSQGADGALVSGTTANSVTYTQLISGGTMGNGSLIRINYRSRTTINAATTMRIYVNSTPDLTGTPVLVGTTNNAGATSFLVNSMLRTLVVKNAANNTEVYLAAGTVSTDLVLYNGISTLNINWVEDQYIVFALQNPASITQVARGSYYLIEKI